MTNSPLATRPSPLAELDSLVRRVDEDRWLASRFAPVDARRRLIALYALNYEIAHTVETVTQAALGDMRLAWWRDAIGRLYEEGAAPAHPVLSAFAMALADAPFPRPTLEALIDARGKDLDPNPFTNWSELEAYVDATAGGVMRLALQACGAAPPEPDLVRGAALAWGCAGLARAEPYWRARGRSVAPQRESVTALRERARVEYERVRGARVAGAVLPALGYVSLVPAYVRTLEAARSDVPLLSRQLRLIRAAATGRL